MNKETFYEELQKINITLTNEQKENIEKFANLLIEYNKHTNITAIKDKEGIYLKHFYDSLTLIKITDLNEHLTLLDVGSGGGFPGIVLKIVFPNLDITLLDSNNKKSEFQKFIIENLELKGIKVVCDRAENYYKAGEKYDIVVARAVSSLNILSELTIPFVKLKGEFIAMKADAQNEIEMSKNGIKTLGGKIKDIVKFNLPIENSQRTLIKVEKVSETPNIYPRSYDKIIKKPLK